MKQTKTPPRTMLALAVAVITTVFPHRALAGLTLTYNANGQFTDSTGTRPWPAHLVPTADADQFVTVFIDEAGSTTGVVSSGTITPVLTWDGVGGKPDKLSAVYSVYDEAAPYDATRYDNVADSFHDPEIHPIMNPCAWILSDHPLTPKPSLSDMTPGVPFPLPPVTISARTHVAPGAPSLTWALLGFRCSLIDISVNAISTDGATGSPPPYFSGTFCNISGSATLPLVNIGSGPKNLTHAWLLVNNEVINEWPAPNPAPTPPGGFPPSSDPRPSVDLAAAFDSTHFGDGSDITVTFRVLDDHQTTHEASTTAKAYNKALCLANNTYGWTGSYSSDGFAMESAYAAASYARAMNHAANSSNQMHRAAIRAAIPTYTVFYADTHGSSQSFADCFATASANEDWVLNDEDTHVAVAAKGGNLPGYNFAMLDGCNAVRENSPTAVDTDDMGQAFGVLGGWTEVNGSQWGHASMVGSKLPDRCFVGWRVLMRADFENFKWTLRFWCFLTGGLRVIDAAVASTLIHPAHGGNGSLSGMVLNFFEYDPTFPGLLGDSSAKLHGVYGGRGRALEWRLPR